MVSIFRDSEQAVKRAWATHTNFTSEAQKLFNNQGMMRIYLDITEAKAKRWFWWGVGGGLALGSVLWGLGIWIA